MMRLKTWIASFSASAVTAASGAQLFFSGIANAQSGSGLTPSPISNADGLKQFICKLAGYLAWFVLALSVLMILWAAYTYITAGDDTEKTSKARRIITYSAVGIAVALIANGFPSIINSFFGSNSNVNNSYC